MLSAFQEASKRTKPPKGSIINDAALSQDTCTTNNGCHACDRTFETCLSWDYLINGVALCIRQTLELGEILQTTVDEVHRRLECNRVLIYRFDPD